MNYEDSFAFLKKLTYGGTLRGDVTADATPLGTPAANFSGYESTKPPLKSLITRSFSLYSSFGTFSLQSFPDKLFHFNTASDCRGSRNQYFIVIVLAYANHVAFHELT